ncbi:DUF2339 domain-containing protein [Crossiella sp. SN42]|uniref:DUF2339 domain-containing protein n=1 Tax=Crossiella sp. SN42 TaxID=2944808 RepID=UPI00207C767C|nr:DUF2339 domain-containing protein [Crossiella sp. SN42]MCO1579467.1 DUF2339 domain-containing protein [Crossiella sp. SN42]
MTAQPVLRVAQELREMGLRLQALETELRSAVETSTGQAPPVPTPPATPVPTRQFEGLDPATTGPQQGFAPAGTSQGFVPAGAQPGFAPAGAPQGFAPAGPPPGHVPTHRPPGFAPPPGHPPQWQPPPPPPPVDPGARQRRNSRIVTWVGGGVTLLGLVLFLVLAAQRGYFGPLPRVAGGAVLGLALVGLALRAYGRPGGRTTGYALAATGFAALYLDIVAATSLHEFLPVHLGLVAGLAVTATGLWLAVRWDAQPLAVGVVLGAAVSAPMLTMAFTPLLVGFLMVLALAAAPVRLIKDWSGLIAAATLPALLGAVLAGLRAILTSAEQHATIAVSFGAAVLAMLLAAAAARLRPSDPVPLVVLASAAVPPLLSAGILDQVGASRAALGLAAVAFAFAAAGKWLTSRFAITAAAVGLVGIFQAIMTYAEGGSRGLTLLGAALVLAGLAWWLRSRLPLFGALGYGIAGLFAALITTVPVRLLFREPTALVEASVPVTGLLLAAVAVALPVAAFRTGLLRGPADSAERVLWLIAAAVALYGTALTILGSALLALPDRDGFLTGHVLVTLSWTAAALVLLLRGIRSAHLRVTGMVLLGIALAKLFLFDLATLDGLARVAAVLGAGLVLLVVGTRYARLVAAVKEEAS